MANTYFEPGDQRAARVKDLFARIARRYDLLNDLQSLGLHRLWKSRLIALARPKPLERALDVCCGTGDLALGLARRGLKVVGLDFSQPMIEIARSRAESILQPPQGLPTLAAPGEVQFLVGDAQRLPFRDDWFEVVTIGYGLRNLPDWAVGLQEMHRVAAPGGRVLVLDFGKPANPFWRAIYFAYLRCFVPVLGLLFAGSATAYAYILVSLEQYPAQHGVAARMHDLGMVNVRIVNLLGGAMSINYGEKPRAGAQPGSTTSALPSSEPSAQNGA